MGNTSGSLAQGNSQGGKTSQARVISQDVKNKTTTSSLKLYPSKEVRTRPPRQLRKQFRKPQKVWYTRNLLVGYLKDSKAGVKRVSERRM